MVLWAGIGLIVAFIVWLYVSGVTFEVTNDCQGGTDGDDRRTP